MQLWSNCCGAKVIHYDICSCCHKECQGFSDDFCEGSNSDDGYDAARDAYLTGDGPAVSSRQIEEDRAWQEECRRNKW